MCDESVICDEPTIREGVFLSDLHLFCPRHVPGVIGQSLRAIVKLNECIVLGGDIFDFRWSNLGSFDRAVSEAIAWIRKLLSETGRSRILYLLGNHDCHPTFVTRLREVSSEHSRFAVFERYIKIGDALFLHGDILDAGLTWKGLANYRKSFHESKPKRNWQQRSYDIVFRLRLHKALVHLRNSPNRTCSALTEFISSTPFEAPNVQRVFFGHTHNYFDSFLSGGLTFFNSGAPLRHLRFQMHRFAFPEPHHVNGI